ncbi:hypothetical protein ACVMDN_001809 [Bradyrhizobium sp. USDA 4510]
MCASASAPSRPSNLSRSVRLALRKVCVAIDCRIASVFLTRWLSSSISRSCSISPRAIVVAIRTAKPSPTSSRMPPITLVIASERHSGATSEFSAIRRRSSR